MVRMLILWLLNSLKMLNMSRILLASCMLLFLIAMQVVQMLLVRQRFRQKWIALLPIVLLLMFLRFNLRMLELNLNNVPRGTLYSELFMSYKRRGRAPTRGKRYSKNWHVGGTRL